jgi:hypothetical protein
MKSFKGIRVLVLGGVLVTLNSGVGLALQEQTAAPAQATGDHVPAPGPEKPAEPVSPASSASERQKKLAADTDKLLALATDLKKQVDKTNKDILSVEVVKKADEIEKLARSMKNDMK